MLWHFGLGLCIGFDFDVDLGLGRGLSLGLGGLGLGAGACIGAKKQNFNLFSCLGLGFDIGHVLGLGLDLDPELGFERDSVYSAITRLSILILLLHLLLLSHRTLTPIPKGPHF